MKLEVGQVYTDCSGSRYTIIAIEEYEDGWTDIITRDTTSWGYTEESELEKGRFLACIKNKNLYLDTVAANILFGV